MLSFSFGRLPGRDGLHYGKKRAELPQKRRRLDGDEQPVRLVRRAPACARVCVHYLLKSVMAQKKSAACSLMEEL